MYGILSFFVIFTIFSDLSSKVHLLAFKSPSTIMSGFKNRIPSKESQQSVFRVDSVRNEFVSFYSDELRGSDPQSATYIYVFGYGSLIWRPGEYLDQYNSFRARGIGWKRMFAQRSTDHRGTPSFPGLVLNLVEDNKLLTDVESTDMDNRLTNGAYCKGLVWLIPLEHFDTVVNYLDEREKGGYSRSIIDVQLNEDTMIHNSGATIQALVYIGQSDNPNFYLPQRDLYASVEIIAAAEGPSGANSDYLLNLVSFLEARNMSDPYLTSLANKIRLRIGPWRLADNGRRFPRPTTCPETGSLSTASCLQSWPVLNGWGSNEFQQLGSRAVIERDHVYAPIEIQIGGNATNVSCPEPAPGSIENAPTFLLVAGGGTSACIQCYHLLVWGSMVKYLLPLIETDDESSPCRSPATLTIREVENVAIGHDHMLILLTSGKVVAVGNNSHGQCAGPPPFTLCQSDVTLVEEQDENTGGSVFVFRRKNGGLETRQPINVSNSGRVLKLATGLRHSAAITSDGSLYTWGDCSHDQVIHQDQHHVDASTASNSSLGGIIVMDSVAEVLVWKPSLNAKLVDVCCGARHTAVVDTAGRIWTFGSNKYGSLGRNTASNGPSSALCRRVPEIVEGLPEGVMWQRVSSGWSHIVARGVDVDGRLVFYSWGRRDMNQYVVDGSCSSDCGHGHGPFPLQQLPDSLELTEIWCGSEFTIAADEQGGLWGCGWNEHGNLGCGRDSSTATIEIGWRRVHTRSSIDANDFATGNRLYSTKRSMLWEGSLSCGGSHVISLHTF